MTTELPEKPQPPQQGLHLSSISLHIEVRSLRVVLDTTPPLKLYMKPGDSPDWKTKASLSGRGIVRGSGALLGWPSALELAGCAEDRTVVKIDPSKVRVDIEQQDSRGYLLVLPKYGKDDHLALTLCVSEQVFKDAVSAARTHGNLLLIVGIRAWTRHGDEDRNYTVIDDSLGKNDTLVELRGFSAYDTLISRPTEPEKLVR